MLIISLIISTKCSLGYEKLNQLNRSDMISHVGKSTGQLVLNTADVTHPRIWDSNDGDRTLENHKKRYFPLTDSDNSMFPISNKVIVVMF